MRSIVKLGILTTTLLCSLSWGAVGGLPTNSTSSFLDSVPLRPYPADLQANEIWVRVDLHARELRVYKGTTLVSVTPHIAIGEKGASPVRTEGSKVTPIGEFRIEVINPESQFTRFYGIDYPNLDTAEAALSMGVINQAEFNHIEQYRRRHGRAPHNTRLGGNIGLHGLGGRSESIHSRLDWTLGCVAVTDQEILELAPWLSIGTRVRIDA